MPTTLQKNSLVSSVPFTGPGTSVVPFLVHTGPPTSDAKNTKKVAIPASGGFNYADQDTRKFSQPLP